MKAELKNLARELKGWAANADAEDFSGLRAQSRADAPPSAAPAGAVCASATAEKSQNAKKAAAPRAGRCPAADAACAQGEVALSQIAAEICACKKCPLGETRIKAVPGVGNPRARIMFVGEGPGYEEDHRGEPFVGRAGALLDKIIAAMGLRRDDVYIANVVKCHPTIDPTDHEKRGNDRPPTPSETAACHDYIVRQIAAIRPEFIIALGASAARALTGGEKTSLSALRGKVMKLPPDSFPIGYDAKFAATFHPAALLRNPNWKKDAWEDIKMVMRELGMTIPPKQS
ncbi:MAG: uracil-DNA glycosylase [Elusimicrobiales bacterium]